MGIAAGIGSAVLWAIASALMTQQAQRMDTLSLSLLRAIGAGLFFVGALFVLGAADDLWTLATRDLWRLALAGFLASGVGETLYAAALFLIGLSRTFTIVVGLHILLAFLLSAIFLDESASWSEGVGAVLIAAGVYAVALYGQPDTLAPSPLAQLRRVGQLARRPALPGRGALAIEAAGVLEAAGAVEATDSGGPGKLTLSPAELHHVSLATVRAVGVPFAAAGPGVGGGGRACAHAAGAGCGRTGRRSGSPLRS